MQAESNKSFSRIEQWKLWTWIVKKKVCEKRLMEFYPPDWTRVKIFSNWVSRLESRVNPCQLKKTAWRQYMRLGFIILTPNRKCQHAMKNSWVLNICQANNSMEISSKKVMVTFFLCVEHQRCSIKRLFASQLHW